MKKQLILAGVTAAALLLGGCGTDKKVEDRVTEIQSNTPTSQSNTTVATETPKSVAMATAPADGKQVFATRCAACHGEKGEGKATYPKLAGLSKDIALSRIKGYVDGTYGKAQKMIMVGQAKGIDDAQKVAVAEYIATLK